MKMRAGRHLPMIAGFRLASKAGKEIAGREIAE